MNQKITILVVGGDKIATKALSKIDKKSDRLIIVKDKSTTFKRVFELLKKKRLPLYLFIKMFFCELKRSTAKNYLSNNHELKNNKELIGIKINPNSPKQVSELLYNEYSSDKPCEICKDKCENRNKCEEYKIWKKYGHKNPNIELRENSFNFPVPERTETNQPSSGKSSLKRFKHYEPKNEWQEKGLEFIDILLHYKKISKINSSFVEGLESEIYRDGRVHPSFNVIAAKSGRATSDSPNCYDEKTEILTDEGWKYFKNLNKNETNKF